MNLVNEQDGIRIILQCFEHTFQALFEVAAVFGTGEQCAHIQGVDDGVSEDVRYIFIHNATRQTFGDGCFTDTGLTNQQWIVFATAAENLYHAFQFAFAADKRVNLAFLGKCIQINGVLLERPILYLVGGFCFTIVTLRFGAITRHFGNAVRNEIHQIQTGNVLFL